MIEKLEWQGKVFATIIRASYMPDGVDFVTEKDNPLQLAVMRRRAGDEVKPHVHKKSVRTVGEVQEVLHIDHGRVEISFYDQVNRVTGTVLGPGDTILLMSGVHGVRFLEESRIIEVKQGPYLGAEEDKQVLEQYNDSRL